MFESNPTNQILTSSFRMLPSCVLFLMINCVFDLSSYLTENRMYHMFYDQLFHRPQRFLGKQHVTPCAYLQSYGDTHQRHQHHVVPVRRSRIQKHLQLGDVGRKQREVKQTLCYRLLGRVVVVRKVLAMKTEEASVQIVHFRNGNWKLGGQNWGSVTQ